MPPLELVPERHGASHELTAEQVVMHIVAACRTSPEAGAASLWAFGSERFRRSAGGSHHLARHLANELFRPLLDHDGALFEPLQLLDDAARQVVRLRSAKYGDSSFLFALARSLTGENSAGRWQVSGLERA